MTRWLPLLLLAVAAPLSAQPAAPASSAEWGMTSASAPLATPASKPPPSAFAAARASTQATGDYFHDFGELIVRVRSVKWIAEICSEAFPATAETNAHAYDDWRMNYGRFVDEMEGQFALIDQYWQDSSAKVRAEGIDAQRLRDKVDADKEGLRQDFIARGAASFQRRCEAYPEILLSPQLDLETSQADYVRSVRLGPR